MIPRLFLILPILTGRLGIKKITISMRRKTHDIQTVYHSSNIDWKVSNNEDHYHYEDEVP